MYIIYRCTRFEIACNMQCNCMQLHAMQSATHNSEGEREREKKRAGGEAKRA